jgi:hypothetical protein
MAPAQEPLSIIDWLATPPTPARPAIVAPAPRITVTPLASPEQTQIGLAPPGISGIPLEIWQGSDSADLASLLRDLPEQSLPAAQSLLMTLLLAETLSPPSTEDTRDAFFLARIDTLVRYGGADHAHALLQSAGALTSPARFARYLDMALLLGTEDDACALLLSNAHLSPSEAHMVFCMARSGDWRGADVIQTAGAALHTGPNPLADLLLRFLHPDAFEGAPLPDVPLSPLTFRLMESIGEPWATGPLPRSYAVADLRDIAGWKAQIEAAERLSRMGTLADNRLLGLYTERLPAASGGVWDRVRALQQFEKALQIGDPASIERHLITVWTEMSQAGLAAPFAALFADQLDPDRLGRPARKIIYEMQLLSGNYRAAAVLSGDLVPQTLRAVALGQDSIPHTPLDEALMNGLNDTALPPPPTGGSGRALITALADLQSGAEGDLQSLTRSLNLLVSLGHGETARRAALQIMLLNTGRI